MMFLSEFQLGFVTYPLTYRSVSTGKYATKSTGRTQLPIAHLLHL